MYNTCWYLCVYYTPTSLFKNAEFFSQALGWLMYSMRRSVLRATYSLAFITVVFYYFLRVIHYLFSGVYPLRTAFHFQGHHGGHLIRRALMSEWMVTYRSLHSVPTLHWCYILMCLYSSTENLTFVWERSLQVTDLQLILFCFFPVTMIFFQLQVF